jgi:hypothetical protein
MVLWCDGACPEHAAIVACNYCKRRCMFPKWSNTGLGKWRLWRGSGRDDDDLW